MKGTTFDITCPGCGAKNRFEMGKRVRCGKCKRGFTPADLTKARPTEPKTRLATHDFALERESDVGFDKHWYECLDASCGFEGDEHEVDHDPNNVRVCPECGGPTRRVADGEDTEDDDDD